jgi:hypothetical protein
VVEDRIAIQSFFDHAPKISTHAPLPINNHPKIGRKDTVCVRSAVAVSGPIWRTFSVVVLL